MGKFLKDSYASTYAARNVKEELDKLIDILQSPAQVRKLVIGSDNVGPRIRSGWKVSGNDSKLSPESPANTPLLCTKTKKKQTRNGSQGDAVDATDAPVPSSSCNSMEKTKRTTLSSSGGRRTSELECRGGDSNSDHIPVGRFSQVMPNKHHV